MIEALTNERLAELIKLYTPAACDCNCVGDEQDTIDAIRELQSLRASRAQSERELHARLAAALSLVPDGTLCGDLRRARDAYVLAQKQSERDAARYRWLRDADETDCDVSLQDYNEDGGTETWYSLRGAQLDAAVDEGIERYTPSAGGG